MSWKDDPEYLRDQLNKAKEEAWKENQAFTKTNDHWIEEMARSDQRIMELETKLDRIKELLPKFYKLGMSQLMVEWMPKLQEIVKDEDG